jgi:hypothetical protein
LMCARTASRVRPRALHQRRRPAALLRAGGGEGRRTWRVHVHTFVGRTRSTPGSCPGRSAGRHAARRSSLPGSRRWRRRGRRPVAAAGLGHRPRSDASLRARGSQAAPGSPPRTVGGPPTGVGSAGQSRCWLRRCRRIRSSPLLAWRRWRRWRVDWGEAGECGWPDAL